MKTWTFQERLISKSIEGVFSLKLKWQQLALRPVFILLENPHETQA